MTHTVTSVSLFLHVHTVTSVSLFKVIMTSHFLKCVNVHTVTNVSLIQVMTSHEQSFFTGGFSQLKVYYVIFSRGALNPRKKKLEADFRADLLF